MAKGPRLQAGGSYYLMDGNGEPDRRTCEPDAASKEATIPDCIAQVRKTPSWSLVHPYSLHTNTIQPP